MNHDHRSGPARFEFFMATTNFHPRCQSAPELPRVCEGGAQDSLILNIEEMFALKLD